MGGEQAASVLATVHRDAGQMDAERLKRFKQPIRDDYEAQGNPWHATARLWDDGIIDPAQTRDVLGLAFAATLNAPIPSGRSSACSGCSEDDEVAPHCQSRRDRMPGDPHCARSSGIRTIAVYSDADAKALHVRMADEAVHIGPSAARESYLVGDKIIEAAKATGAEAIHPGYGFLSENAGFAQAVIDAGLIWVGPKPDSIRAMGLKDAAKKLMAEAGVPVTPGYLGDDQDPSTSRRKPMRSAIQC